MEEKEKMEHGNLSRVLIKQEWRMMYGFSAESSSYSYLLPAEAGVANWYRTIMLAITSTTWRPAGSRQFTDTQCAFLAGFQREPVSRECDRVSGIVKRNETEKKKKIFIAHMHRELSKEINYDCIIEYRK